MPNLAKGLATSLARSLAVPAAEDRTLVGVGGFSTLSHFLTQTPGGEPGVSSGFGAAVLFRYDSYSSVSGDLLSGIVGTTGWYFGTFQYTLNAGIYNAGNGFIGGTPYTFTPGDVGKVFLAVSRISVAGGLEWFILRAPTAAGAVAVAHYGPGTSNGIGNRPGNNTLPATHMTVLSALTYRGAPTNAQILALYDTVRATGDLPLTFDGATVNHHWSVKREIGNLWKVPRSSFGVRNFTAASNYASAAAAGYAGNPAGFWIAAWIRPDATFTTSNARFAAKTDGFSKGWRLMGYSSNAYYFNIFRTSGSEVSAGATALTGPQEQGQPVLLVGVWTGTVARLYLRRAQAGVDAALAAYAPAPTNALQLGRDTAFGSDAITIFGLAGGDGVPTLAQIQQLTDIVESTGRIAPMPGQNTSMLYDVHADAVAAGGVPATLVDRAGSSNLTRSGTLELAVHDARATPCPVALTDNVSRAPADALARVGSPIVRTFDPTVDGRELRGVIGMASTTYFRTADPGGLAGVNSGFWHSAYFVVPNAVTGTDLFNFISIRLSLNGFQGWSLYWRTDSKTLIFGVATGSDYGVQSAQIPVSQGRVVVVTHVLDATNPASMVLRSYLDGVEFGAPTAVTAYGPWSGRHSIGGRVNADYGADKTLIFGVAGGHAIPTAAEVLEHARATHAAGRMQRVSGKTSVLYDIVADVDEANGRPTTLLDRVGSQHMTRTAGHVSTVGALTGITGFTSTAMRLQRAQGVGTVSGQSFWSVLAFRVDAQSGITSKFRMPYSRYLTTPSRQGWDWITTGMNASLYFESVDTGNNIRAPGPMTLTLGTTYVLHALYDVAAGTVTLYSSGTQIAQVASVGAYVAATAPGALECIGADVPSSYNSDGLTIFAVGGGGASLPTVQEMTTQATAFATSGVLTAISGKQTHLTNLKTDFAENGGDVPQFARERIATDQDFQTAHLARVERSRRVERVFASDVRPLLRGFTSTDNVANRLTTAAPAPIPGRVRGFYVSLLFMITSQAVASTTRALLSTVNSAGTAGYYLQTQGTNSALSWAAYNGAGTAVTSPIASLASADVGKLLLATMVFDGLRLRLYWKRAEQGSGSTIVGYSPSTSGLMVLRDPRATLPLPTSGINVFGICGADYVPTIAEVQAQFDATMATDEIVGAGRTEWLVSFTRDLAEAGDAMPATLRDRVGANHMSIVGSPSIVLSYSRPWGW